MTRTLTTCLAAVAFAATATASASAQTYTPESQRAYEACKRADTQNQVLGGVIGGLAGGLLGNEIEKGEGTLLGGAAGAYAGTRVANKDCESRLVPATRSYNGRTSTYTNTQTLPAYQDSTRSSYNTGNGMIRVEENGRVFYVSQSDYERFYR